MVTLSPSPRELVARLTDDECVGLDFLLQEPELLEDMRKRPIHAVYVDYPLAPVFELVPDQRRLGYLTTLAVQFQALGASVLEDTELDARVREWNDAREDSLEERIRMREIRQREAAIRQREAAIARAQAEAAQRKSDEALPPAARKAVQRRRRRQARRAAR